MRPNTSRHLDDTYPFSTSNILVAARKELAHTVAVHTAADAVAAVHTVVAVAAAAEESGHHMLVLRTAAGLRIAAGRTVAAAGAVHRVLRTAVVAVAEVALRTALRRLHSVDLPAPWLQEPERVSS